MQRLIPADIERTVYDVAIIGAGINGAGIARDAALRGLRVLLLDKGDLSAGTSSWSTRLIHGGLRYLEYAEIGLVRESLRERERLFHIAPHLVKPLPLIIPIYGEGKRGRWSIRAGMIAYDLLSFDKSLDRHQMLSRAEALARVPGLNPANLRGAALYYDAQIEYAERLVVENALAASAAGAVVLNYARVDRFLLDGARVRGLVLTDLPTGRQYEARAEMTLNVAGPWVDQLLRNAGRAVKTLIGGTKGSHIIVDPFPGAPRNALYVEAHADGRPFFIIPWNNLYLIGTTDTRYTGDLDEVQADEQEIAYLLAETNRVIPRARLGREAVLYTYSGVRPLPFVEEGREGGITRRHFIHDHAPDLRGLLSVVGGKLTTYRSLAEEAVDLVVRQLGREPRPCQTAIIPLPGAMGDRESFGRSFVAGRGLPEAVSHRLLRVYGTRAAGVLELAGEGADLMEPLGAVSPAVGAEVLFAFRHEAAETLADCFFRRMMIGLNRELGRDALNRALDLLREHLGWDEARAEREREAYLAYLKRFNPHETGREHFAPTPERPV